MTQLKSLAHPEWPYAGTVHEWRGFVRDESDAKPVITSAPKLTSGGTMYHDRGFAGLPYQKQNFGPDLD